MPSNYNSGKLTENLSVKFAKGKQSKQLSLESLERPILVQEYTMRHMQMVINAVRAIFKLIKEHAPQVGGVADLSPMEQMNLLTILLEEMQDDLYKLILRSIVNDGDGDSHQGISEDDLLDTLNFDEIFDICKAIYEVNFTEKGGLGKFLGKLQPEKKDPEKQKPGTKKTTKAAS